MPGQCLMTFHAREHTFPPSCPLHRCTQRQLGSLYTAGSLHAAQVCVTHDLHAYTWRTTQHVGSECWCIVRILDTPSLDHDPAYSSRKERIVPGVPRYSPFVKLTPSWRLDDCKGTVVCGFCATVPPHNEQALSHGGCASISPFGNVTLQNTHTISDEC